MTHMLEQAIDKVKHLSETEQDAIAAMILEELRDEQQWQETLANTQGLLHKLADQARDEIRQGKVSNVGWDEL